MATASFSSPTRESTAAECSAPSAVLPGAKANDRSGAGPRRTGASDGGAVHGDGVPAEGAGALGGSTVGSAEPPGFQPATRPSRNANRCGACARNRSGSRK